MPKQTWLILGVFFLLMLTSAIPLHYLGVDLIPESFNRGAIRIAVSLALLGVLKTLKRAPLMQLLLEVISCGLLFTLLVNLPTALLLRLPIPFSDSAALSLDTRLGIDVSAWVRLCRHHPYLSMASHVMYNSLAYVDIVGTLLPVMLRRPRWSSEMFVALSISLLLTWVIMAFAQGIGPWRVNGVLPTDQQAELATAALRYKTTAHVYLDTYAVNRFIAFPSWHVISAMLLVFTTARVRALREISVLWAMLVAISAITQGWHYGVDLLSGVLVASVSMVVSRYLHVRWAAQAEKLPANTVQSAVEPTPALQVTG